MCNTNCNFELRCVHVLLCFLWLQRVWKQNYNRFVHIWKRSAIIKHIIFQTEHSHESDIDIFSAFVIQQRTVLTHSRASERSEQSLSLNQPLLLPATLHRLWVCIPSCHGNRRIWLADPRELLEFLIKWLSGLLSVWRYCRLTAGIQPHKEPLITAAISLRHVLMAAQS